MQTFFSFIFHFVKLKKSILCLKAVGCIFLRARLIQQNFKVFSFCLLACLITCLLDYLFAFLLTCLSKYTWKHISKTIKHFGKQTSSNALSCASFIQNSSSIFHTSKCCDRLKFDISTADRKPKKPTFSLGLGLCHKLWDKKDFFLSLTQLNSSRYITCTHNR